MITAHLPILFGVGVLAGVVSTVVSLASVVSYPALLALGLPALSANVTNTVALVFTAVGAAAGSQRELTGQRSRVLRLGLLTALGGATGAVLLLVTPSGTFELIAPWLIAGASLILLLQPRAGRLAERSTSERSRLLRLALFTVAVYTGYFGAAGGILTLAVLSAMIDLPLWDSSSAAGSAPRSYAGSPVRRCASSSRSAAWPSPSNSASTATADRAAIAHFLPEPRRPR